MRIHPACDQIRSEVVTAKLIGTAGRKQREDFAAFLRLRKRTVILQRTDGNERLQILVELANHGPEQRLESFSNY
jgi:hypothetical protein